MKNNPHGDVESDVPAPANGWRVVAQSIRQGMLHGDYAPGQRLNDEDVARRYASTRFLVRKALDELAADRLIDRLPNRGARLRQMSVSTAIELYAIRGALDGLIATHAAIRTTPRLSRSLAAVRTEIVRAVQEVIGTEGH